MPYPFPKPFQVNPDGPWILQTEKGLKTFVDVELAWSTYQFAKFMYEKDYDRTNQTSR